MKSEKSEKLSPHGLKIKAANTLIASSSRFCPSLTGLVVHGGEECGDMTEMTPKMVSCVAVQSFMTLSLQLDLQ